MPSSSAGSSLLLNIAPIRFAEYPVMVGVQPYRDHDQLRALREEHWRTHVFRKEGEEIVSVAVVPGILSIGEDQRKVNLAEHPYLCAALIRNTLVGFLYSRGIVSFDYDPIQYIHTGKEDNLLAASIPAGAGTPPWLSVRVLNEMTVRPFDIEGQGFQVGLALDFQTKYQITSPCQTLVSEGLDITGLFVGANEASADPRVTPRRRVLGRVAGIEGTCARLEEKRSEETPGRVRLGDVYLEARHDALERCFLHAFGQDASVVQQTLRQQAHLIQSGPEKRRRLGRRIQNLASRREPFEMVPGAPFTIEPFLEQASGRSFPTVNQAERPVYVFDPTGARTSQYSDPGLTEYGPYSAFGNLFTPNIPNVAVVCQKKAKGRVGQFLAKLRDGIPNSRFATGLLGKYRLAGIHFEYFLAESETAESYEQAVYRAIRAYGQEDKRIHLALVQIDEGFKALQGSENPYLVTKAGFLSHQVPVQEFTIQKISQPDGTLAHILNTMGLAIYAKLGGTPWLLPASRQIEHELVFGLGSAQINRGRFGEARRYVGITTVFTGDGNYRLSNLSQAVPFRRYQESLLESLKETVSKVRRDNNWQPGETIRLIFHAFKPMKYAEVDAVTDVLGELADFEVEFAFLHLAEEHPYLLFDTRQRGTYAREQQAMKGQLAPPRGLYFGLTEFDTLMQLVGTREVKKPEDGLPRPLLLKRHPRSSFTDDIYLARQVYLFSCHSWRNFTPSALPVTISYSNLIARMLGELETVDSWNPNSMYGRIGETRWFL
jgi:hypothetical protein